jgi:transposase InsO family protein
MSLRLNLASERCGWYGVESICKVPPIAPSTHHSHIAQRQDATRLSVRARQDLALKPEIARVFAENFAVYGVRKVWRQMMREGFAVARCTVERLMRDMGLAGVIRGKPVRTTISDKAAPCPLDHVNRQFRAPAPNRLWVSDFTYVATWAGFVYVAFVIDTYARRIVGWRASRTAHAGFVLDALEQALHDRRPVHRGGLVHHSDRGSQYVSIKYTERLAEAGIEPSVGSVGDSYDNALAETINGLYKAEVIHRRGPWRSFEAVEYATLERVDWFNHRRLLEPIGNIPPAEAEDQYYAAADNIDMAAWLTTHGLRQARGGSELISLRASTHA